MRTLAVAAVLSLCGLESLAQAMAWLAPFPPGETAKEFAVRVSPGRGWWGTYDTRSMFREPKTVISGVWAIVNEGCQPLGVGGKSNGCEK
ncbi:hypothetical protein PoMZ_03776 [Pyricularia oryzae]|uniref:Uncharacterized protein n=1 Tax=Pyricularia oryzae TaxID=318829 RepID=A0A4P7N821_PYROR|nr:hypothetical protein PoMZ_03776 [Pyricularia oryzae]